VIAGKLDAVNDERSMLFDFETVNGSDWLSTGSTAGSMSTRRQEEVQKIAQCNNTDSHVHEGGVY
jgi:hypothetical protein